MTGWTNGFGKEAVNDTLERIEVKLRRNAEKEIIACPHCVMVTKQVDETFDEMSARAWEYGDYFIELEQVLPGFAPEGMLMVPCEEHVQLIKDQDEVGSNIAFDRKQKMSHRTFLAGVIRELAERDGL